MTITESSIRRLLRRWRPIVGIGDEWTIAIEIMAGEENEPDKAHVDDQAYTVVLDGYSTATVTYHSWLIEDAIDLERVTLHELLHCKTAAVANVIRSFYGKRGESVGDALRETLVCDMTAALLRARRR